MNTVTVFGRLIPLPAIYAGAAVLVLGTGGAIYHAKIQRVKRETLALERARVKDEAVQQQSAVVTALQDSLQEERNRTNIVRANTQAASASYAHQRAAINTSAPQPPGVPAGYVAVPKSFIESADSLARLVPELVATINRERAASDRLQAADSVRTALLMEEVAQLKIAIKNASPGVYDKVKWAGVGAVLGLGVALIKLHH